MLAGSRARALQAGARARARRMDACGAARAVRSPHVCASGRGGAGRDDDGTADREEPEVGDSTAGALSRRTASCCVTSAMHTTGRSRSLFAPTSSRSMRPRRHFPWDRLTARPSTPNATGTGSPRLCCVTWRSARSSTGGTTRSCTRV